MSVVVVTLLVVGIGWLDAVTGTELDLSVFYFLPVSFAAWRLGLIASLVTALICAMIWLWADFAAGHVFSTEFQAVWTTVMHLCAFATISGLVNQMRQLLIVTQKRLAEWEKARAELVVLEGLLSNCARCKKIQNDQGVWQQMESYISSRSSVLFSHGLCPDCARKTLEAAGIKS